MINAASINLAGGRGAWRVLLVGRNLSNSANAGLTYLNANNNSGNRNSNIGSHGNADLLSCLLRPRHLPKHKACLINVLVGRKPEGAEAESAAL